MPEVKVITNTMCKYYIIGKLINFSSKCVVVNMTPLSLNKANELIIRKIKSQGVYFLRHLEVYMGEKRLNGIVDYRLKTKVCFSI